MVKARPGWSYLNVPMPDEEFNALKKLKAGRKWRTYLKQIQDDARKAAEVNQELRDKVSFWNAQSERANAEVRRLREKYEG